jgi:hypothetical protein
MNMQAVGYNLDIGDSVLEEEALLVRVAWTLLPFTEWMRFGET